jgi:hypothetical protein
MPPAHIRPGTNMRRKSEVCACLVSRSNETMLRSRSGAATHLDRWSRACTGSWHSLPLPTQCNLCRQNPGISYPYYGAPCSHMYSALPASQAVVLTAFWHLNPTILQLLSPLSRGYWGASEPRRTFQLYMWMQGRQGCVTKRQLLLLSSITYIVPRTAKKCSYLPACLA